MTSFRRTLRNLVAALMLVAGSASVSSAAPILSFNPQTTNVNVGDTFSVDLILSDFADLGPGMSLLGFTAFVSFDNSIIDFDSATFNPSFSLASAGETSGTLSLSGSALGITPTNPYTLATLQFGALQAGSSPLAFANASITTFSTRIAVCLSCGGDLGFPSFEIGPIVTTDTFSPTLLNVTIGGGIGTISTQLVNTTNGLVNVERVPEPATLALFGMGAALLFVRARMARTRN